MRAVIQRVKNSVLRINGIKFSSIDQGLLVLLGIASTDNNETIRWMANKIAHLRIFPDENEKMNLSVLDIKGDIMIISNFTLYGDVQRGFRPSFTDAAPPNIAEKIYLQFLDYMRNNYNIKIAQGIFGAMMDIEFINYGPVTIIIEK